MNTFVDTVDHGHGGVEGHVPQIYGTVAINPGTQTGQEATVAGAHGDEGKDLGHGIPQGLLGGPD